MPHGCTGDFGTCLGGSFGTRKGIKTDGFQNGKVWGLSKPKIVGASAILVPVWMSPKNIQKKLEKAMPCSLPGLNFTVLFSGTYLL